MNNFLMPVAKGKIPEKIFTNTANIIFSKVTFLTVTIHWLFVLLAVYDRGGLYYSFHFYYEPISFKLISVLNLPTIMVADFVIRGHPFIDADNPARSIVLLALSITFQWTMIGSFIKYAFFNKSVM